MPEMLNGAVYGTEPMPPTRWPAISNGGGPSATNAVVAVVGVRIRSTSSNTSAIAREQLPAPLLRAQRAGRCVMRSICSNPARDTGVTSSSRPAARLEVVGGRRRCSRGCSTPARAAGGGSRRRRARCRRRRTSASAASCARFSTSGSHTAKPSVDDHAARSPRRRSTAAPDTQRCLVRAAASAATWDRCRSGPRSRRRSGPRRAPSGTSARAPT